MACYVFNAAHPTCSVNDTGEGNVVQSDMSSLLSSLTLPALCVRAQINVHWVLLIASKNDGCT